MKTFLIAVTLALVLTGDAHMYRPGHLDGFFFYVMMR